MLSMAENCFIQLRAAEAISRQGPHHQPNPMDGLQKGQNFEVNMITLWYGRIVEQTNG